MYYILINLLKPVLRCALVISRDLGLRSRRQAEKLMLAVAHAQG